MIGYFAQSDPWAGVDVGEQLFYFSPMIILVCTMLALVACPIVLGRGPRLIASVAAIGVVLAFCAALRVAGMVADGGMSGLSPHAGAGMLIADNLSVWFQLFLMVFLGGVMWLWWIGGPDRERNAPEFFVLLLGSALGMALMASTQNLLMMIIAIETASLPSFAIVGFDKRDRRGAEASLKYMIFGAVCAAIMLYGASILYGLVGSLNAADVADYTAHHLGTGANGVLLGVGLLCFLVGVAFKISAVPFHFWCPDAFEGARIEVTTWLSVASKAAGLVLLGRLVLIFASSVSTVVEMQHVAPLAWAIGIMATVTCTVGNFSAYKQRSMKRLLAYSSIAHAGYMMMALAVFVHPDIPGHTAGITALLVYIMIYLFMNLGAFGITALVLWETGNDDIESFSGLMRRAPFLAIPMIICLVSLVGIPPFAGFIGKWWVLVAVGGMQNANYGEGITSLGSLGWFLVIAIGFNTLISLFYYLRVIVKMCLHDDAKPPLHVPLGGTILANICGLALFVLFVFAQPLGATAARFSKGLYEASPSLAQTASADVSNAAPIK